MNRRAFRPAEFQPELPRGRFVLAEKPGEESVPMDVLFVGGGPAGLAGAIALKRLVEEDRKRGDGLGEVEIAVLEKAGSLGEHCLSGAVVNPRAFRALLPELEDADFPFRGPVMKDRVYLMTETRALRIPAPPTMRNHGNYVASICEIVRWLGEKAEALGINIFTGFAADALLVDSARVTGVRTTPIGLDRQGNPGSGYSPPTDVTAKVTVLSEGTRGSLTQAYLDWQGIGSDNPPIYALGVKEIWEIKRPLDAVVHALGWPLPKDAFGGSFFYPMADNLAAIGLVGGLDYRRSSLDLHVLFQEMKRHPFFRRYLEGGEMLEWGAKTIPEGGWYAVPQRLHGDSLLIVGDAAGFVDVPSLKGIHYAMQSGIFAARTIFEALKAEDTSARRLCRYDALLRDSYIREDLHRTRNMRLAFKKGFFKGGALASLMTLTRGALPGGRIQVSPDAGEERVEAPPDSFTPDGKLTFSKTDAVFRSGNKTRDDIPSHLIAGKEVPPEVATFYEHMCPAGVYENQDGKLVINAPNCVDCKTTDVLGPRWTPREGGSGTKYRRM